MRIFFPVAVILFLSFSLPGQNQWCGSDLSRLSKEEQQAALAFSQRKFAPLTKSNVIDSVPVTVHIVESRSQGAIEFTAAEVEAELVKVNRIYGGTGIYFFICGSPRYIDGDGSYNFNTGDDLNSQYYVPNTLNIYFVNEIVTTPEFTTCGFAKFPFSGVRETRYVMMNKRCATDGSTLIHELGHFYGLYHTHETAFGLEYVDGSNCSTAGDRLCDTSADPNLLLGNLMSGCTYVGNVRDPKGSLYVPPVTNFMSYAPAACQRFFSEAQQLIIQNVHQNENAYLIGNCDFYPDFEISQVQDLLNIRSDQKISTSFTLQQSNTDRDYNVNLKISLAEDPDEVGLLLHEERLTLQAGTNTLSLDFDLDFPIFQGTGTYYLKAFIDADNEVIERTEKNNIAFTTVVVDNSQLDAAVLFPNPVQDEIKLFIRNSKAQREFKIRIFRYDGRLIWEDDGYKNQEEFFQLIDVSQFPLGLYLITVDFEKVDAAYTFKFFKR